MKTNNEKEHNTFVHSNDNTFACKHQCFDLKHAKRSED